MEEFSLNIPEIENDVKESFVEEKNNIPNDRIKEQANKNTVAIFNVDFENMGERERIIKPLDDFGLSDIRRSSNKNSLLNKRMKDIKKGGNDAKDIEGKLTRLNRQVKDLDPSGVNFDSTGIIGKITNPIKRYFDRYEKAEVMIENIVKSLDDSSRTLQNDNVTLLNEEGNLREITKKLMVDVELGKQMDASIESQILEAEAQGVEAERIKFVREEVLFPLRQRLMDMEQMIVVNQQGIVSMNVIRRNNKELIRGITRAQNVTITALKTGVMAASALYNQKVTMDKIKVLNSTTENIIDSTSQILRQQGVEIQKSSAETMISPEVLKSAFTEALAAIQDVSTYKEQSLAQMKETIETFNEMAIEGEKIVSEIEMKNN